MRRCIFNSATAVSLTIFVVSTVLWAWSYSEAPFAECHPHNSNQCLRFSIGDGRIFLNRSRIDASGFDAFGFDGWRCGKNSASSGSEVHGYFGITSDTDLGGYSDFGVVFPCWLLVAVMAIVPGLRLARYLRTDSSSDSCRRCGYNLTGNVSGICPECGTAIRKFGNPPASTTSRSLSQKLLKLAVAVSLLPAAILICFWLSSYFYGSTFTILRVHFDGLGRSYYTTEFGRGRIRIDVDSMRIVGKSDDQIVEYRRWWGRQNMFTLSLFRPLPSIASNRWGFGGQNRAYSWGPQSHEFYRDRTLVTPVWVFVLPTILIPILWIRPYLLKKRARHTQLLNVLPGGVYLYPPYVQRS